MAGGNRLPDWVVSRPVFVRRGDLRLRLNRAHQSDIGGGVAGDLQPRGDRDLPRRHQAAAAAAHRARHAPAGSVAAAAPEQPLPRPSRRRPPGDARLDPDRGRADARAGPRTSAPSIEACATSTASSITPTAACARPRRPPDGVYLWRRDDGQRLLHRMRDLDPVTITKTGDPPRVDYTGTDPQ